MDIYQKKYLKYKTKYELLKKQIGGDPIKRIMGEMARLRKEPIPGINVIINEEDILNKSTGTIEGPPGTPYEGHIWTVSIIFPERYPMVPPTVKFINPIWHPNISVTGGVCISILKTDGEYPWNPALTAGKVLQSIQSMLTDPNPSSAYNGEAARQLIDDPTGKTYNQGVKTYIERYETPTVREDRAAAPATHPHRPPAPPMDRWETGNCEQRPMEGER